jgi:hypothetical protein
MLFGIRLFAHALSPREYVCPLSNVQLAVLQPAQFTEHILACRHCGAPHFFLRHDKVLKAIFRTICAFGGVCRLNPRDLPLPGNMRGGPDITVYMEKAFAGDVEVCKDKPDGATCDSIKAAVSSKIRHYETFAKATAFSVLPIVWSIYCEPCDEFMTALHAWSEFLGAPALVFELRNLVACELLRGIKMGVDELFAKQAAQHLARAALCSPSGSNSNHGHPDDRLL